MEPDITARPEPPRPEAASTPLEPEPPRPEAASTPLEPERKPAWLKVKAPGGERYRELKQTLRELDLYTVCEEARCPNVAECWSQGTATVMLLGHTCTRGCRFCAVTTGNPRGAVDPREPEHVARAIGRLGLRYVVLTMVDRDDLLDGGAAIVARTVSLLHAAEPELLVETLVGDFCGRTRDVDAILAAGPDVYAHNLEVVRRLTPTIRDRRSSYDQSLRTLRHAADAGLARFVKSSLMVGLGETPAEVTEALGDLRAAGVEIVTLGQYLRPTPRHAPVHRYVPPEEFAAWEAEARGMGFSFVAAGPLVRSSYHAAEAFVGGERARRVGAGASPRPEGAPPPVAGAPGRLRAEPLVPATALIRR